MKKEAKKGFPTHYTYDLDGTLIDGKSEIKDGVIEMFDEILKNVKMPVFTIASGARVNQIDDVMRTINSRLKNGKIKYNVVANSGSLIRTTSGKTSINPLSGRDFMDICKIVKAISPNAVVVYRTMLYDYMDFAENSVQKALHCAIQKFGPKFGVEPEEVLEKDILKIARNNEVMNILIMSLNPNDKKKIYNALKNHFGISDIFVSDGTAIDVSNFGKKNALTKRFGLDTVKKMVYVGDGKNDIEMLNTARYSFAVGKKLKVISQADYAITDFRQISDHLFHNKDIAKESEERINSLKKSFVKGQIAKLQSVLRNEDEMNL